MKNQNNILIAFCMLFTYPAFSQAPEIEWQNTIGGSDVDLCNTIIQTTDGGFLIGGNTWSEISGDKTEENIGLAHWEDYWVIKLSAAGMIEWQNDIGGTVQPVCVYDGSKQAVGKVSAN